MTIKTNRYTSLVVAIIFACFPALNAQEYYVASTISPELIKNANAVIRLQATTINIKSVSSATYSMRQIVTILNKEGLYHSVYYGSEDKFTKLHFEKLTIYDKTGKKVKSFGSSHLEPYNPYTNNIYDDNYYYYLDPEYMIYPFTVEITYSFDFNGILSLPSWYYYDSYNTSIEKSLFSVYTAPDYKLRYRQQKIKDDVKPITDNSNIMYRWEANNLPALLSEPASTGLAIFSPAVFFSPSDFEIQGIKGNCETWESFGSFRTTLLKGRDLLEGPINDSIRILADKTEDTTEIVRRIYKYMQNKTRYVSVQEGIGGWQPILAQSVDRTQYGDCKGLTNYTKALLNIAGIKSIYTVVRAGKYEDDIKTDFPSNQTNHAILCVPRGADTIWLECTSQKSPFNYLGSFTDDRHVLLITENGGKLVRTPRYTSDQNSQFRKAIVTLDLLGNATASVSTKYNYYYFDENIALIYLDQEDIKKRITNSIDIPGFTLVDFFVKQKDPDKPALNEDISLKMTKYATVMGDRMLIPLNLMNRWERLPSNIADRKMDIEFKRDRSEADTITYKIPAGYSVASVPKPVEYTSPFGYYRADVIVNGNELTYIRQMKYNKCSFPASQYPQLLEFNKSIATADNTKIALKKL